MTLNQVRDKTKSWMLAPLRSIETHSYNPIANVKFGLSITRDFEFYHTHGTLWANNIEYVVIAQSPNRPLSFWVIKAATLLKRGAIKPNEAEEEMATVSFENLRTFHNNACGEWKQRIEKLVKNPFNDTVVVPVQLVKKGYSEANDTMKSLLEHSFPFLKEKTIKDLYIAQGKREQVRVGPRDVELGTVGLLEFNTRGSHANNSFICKHPASIQTDSEGRQLLVFDLKEYKV